MGMKFGRGAGISILLFCMIGTSGYCDTEVKKTHKNINKTIGISQELPEQTKLVTTPDKLLPYYQTLDSTHFTYRCYDPYVLKSKSAAIEVCEIFPVKLQIFDWPETEVIHLIRGEVTITEMDGATTNYHAGDIFVLPEGFKGIWSQKEKIIKVTVRNPLFWKE
jgi:hypothetical protein